MNGSGAGHKAAAATTTTAKSRGGRRRASASASAAGVMDILPAADDDIHFSVVNTTKPRRRKKAAAEDRPGRLVSYGELPEHMKENEFILKYYRAEWPLKNAFFSLFSWHNETINVWTHLIGFFIFLGLTAFHLRHVPEVADLLNNFSWVISTSAVENASYNQANFIVAATSFVKLEKSNTVTGGNATSPPGEAAELTARWPFFVFMGGSMFCLLSSSLCHLLCCHSHGLSLFLVRLDYVGIAVMIVASFFPPIYYIFQCEPHWQLLYLVAIAAMGVVTILTLLSPNLSAGRFRVFRALLFSGMGFSGLVPAVHATVVNWDEPQRPVTLAYESAMAAAYVTGTLFYVGRVPERWRPGRFDLIGHSHQIFHVFVVAGALAHYAAAIVFLEWRDRVGCDRLVI